MNASTLSKTAYGLRLGTIVLALLMCASVQGAIELPNVGDSLTSRLTYNPGDSNGVVSFGTWANHTTTMTGTVVRLNDSYRYSYTMSAAERAIGHMIVETMPVGANLPFGSLVGDCFNATLTVGNGTAASWATIIGAHLMGNGAPTNPGLPSNVYGMRIVEPRNDSGELLEGTEWTLTFDSLRAPEWGDMYSLGSSDTYAHNTGFEFEDGDLNGLYHLPTPGNSLFVQEGVVPEASSVITWCLLGMIGLYGKARRFF